MTYCKQPKRPCALPSLNILLKDKIDRNKPKIDNLLETLQIKNHILQIKT